MMFNLKEFVEFMRELNIYTTAVRLIMSLVLGAIIGFERERRGHAAGFRTHILVALGSTMTAMVGVFIVQTLKISADSARISAQVVSGIGFLGVGTILITGGKHVRGLTTAAGLWSTAAVGLAVGYGFYEGAIICMILIGLVLASFKYIDVKLSTGLTAVPIYLEINGADNVNSTIKQIEAFGLKLTNTEVVAAKSRRSDTVGIEVTIKRSKAFEKQNITEVLMGIDAIIMAVELM